MTLLTGDELVAGWRVRAADLDRQAETTPDNAPLTTFSLMGRANQLRSCAAELEAAIDSAREMANRGNVT